MIALVCFGLGCAAVGASFAAWMLRPARTRPVHLTSEMIEHNSIL